MAKSGKTPAVQAKGTAAPAVTQADPGMQDAAVEVEITPSLQVKKKDLVERVALRSGVKKPVARDLTEAVLAVIGEALDAGETLVVPPLGKVSLARRTERPGGEMLHLRLKRPGPAGAATEGTKKDDETGADPLAKPEE